MDIYTSHHVEGFNRTGKHVEGDETAPNESEALNALKKRLKNGRK